MSPWLVPGSPVYRIRIRGKSWRLVVSTGMRAADGAREVEAFAGRLYDRRRWDILDAIKAKQLTLADAFDADRRGQLDDVLRTINDVDLDPLVDEWARNANAKYVRQVRCLIPERFRFPRSEFTKAVVSRFLATLDVSGPTKNRYRAALSVFARWLVERDVLEHNPVRDVSGYAEHGARDRWLTSEQAVRVVLAAKPIYRPALALLYGAGAEIGAVLKLKTSDIGEPPTVHLRGSKTRWRNRVVRVESWAWEIMRQSDYLTLGEAPLFPFLTYDAVYRAHRDALKACGLEGYTLHDARHSYAVNALRAGLKAQVVAHQLGHRDATMVTRVYGRYLPDERDYQPQAPAQATSRRTGGRK